MKKSEEKKLEKFQIAKLTAEQQVEVKVKGGNNGNPPDWDLNVIGATDIDLG